MEVGNILQKKGFLVVRPLMVWLRLFYLATKCRLRMRIRGIKKRFLDGLREVDGLIPGADREEPVAVVRYNDYFKLLVQVKPRRFLNLFD